MLPVEIAPVDLEQGTHHHHRSVAGSEVSCMSDVEEDGSCYSRFYSTTAGSYDDYCLDGGFLDSQRVSSWSSCSEEQEDDDDDDDDDDVETGVAEMKVHLTQTQRDCRICHLGLESNNSPESGAFIELGCSCKDDLAAAHKHCAETWFKIKGNKTCEICHSVAHNVVGLNETDLVEQSNEASNPTTLVAVPSSVPHSEAQSFWHGHRFLNFLLACMVFAFVISWLFHFKVPSS